MSNADPTTTTTIATALYDGTTDHLYLNGSLAVTGDMSSTPLDTRTTTGVAHGLVAGPGYYGDISEIIVYDRSLSTAELNAVHTYLKNRFNIP
jgi:hypothetical protein